MTLSAVFFDLDGTLLDTAPDLSKALCRLMEREGKTPPDFAQMRRVVSDGAYALLQLGFGIDRDHPETAELRQALLDYYLQDLSSDTHIFPGLDHLIAHLHRRDVPWGIVTNKPVAYAEPLMERFEFASPPVCLICPEHVSQRKPHPEALELACRVAACDREAAIYIGDHIRDIQCGRNAGMRTIAVGYGYVALDQSPHDWGADHVVDHGDELWPVVESYM